MVKARANNTTKFSSDKQVFQHTDRKTNEELSGSAQIVTKILPSNAYAAGRKFEADVMLRLEDEKTATEIGMIVGFVVDKTADSDKGEAAWIVELAKADDQDDETDEVRHAVQHFYTKTGTRRAKFKAFTDELDSTQIVYIDAFVLHDPIPGRAAGKGKAKSKAITTWQGRGVGPQFLQLFLVTMSQKFTQVNGTALCLLSPAASNDSTKGQKLTHQQEIEVEDKLIAKYKLSGFEVLVKGSPDVKNSATYMGKLL